jgi:hypothetical protein
VISEALLRRTGYSGWISLEDLSTKRDPLSAYP